MLRYALVLAVLALAHEGIVPTAAAEDNPVVRMLVREVVKKELSTRDSKDKGWQQGNTWIWLDNPAANLAADVNSFTLEDGRFTLDGRASALIGFSHKVALPVGSKTLNGQALIYLSFKASAQAGEKLTGSKVTIGRLEIHELRLRGEALHPFEGIIQDGVNLLLKHKKHDIEKSLEAALNRANIAGRFRATGF